MSTKIDSNTALIIITKVLLDRKRQDDEEIKKETKKDTSHEKIVEMPYEGVMINNTAFNASYSQSHQNYYTPTFYRGTGYF